MSLSQNPATSAHLDDVIARLATTPDHRREELNAEFFDAAIDLFNETCAGTVELADGRTFTVNPIIL